MRAQILGIKQVEFDFWVIDMNDDGELTSVDFALLRKLLLGNGAA